MNELLLYGMSESLIFSFVFLQVNWRRNNGRSILLISYFTFQNNPRNFLNLRTASTWHEKARKFSSESENHN